MNTMISIIIPVYKVEKYLDKLVEAEKKRKSKPFMIKPIETEYDREMNGIY